MDTYISSHFMLLSNGVLDINYYRSRITETIKEIWASTTTDRSNRIWTCRSMRWKHKPPLYHQRYSQAIGVQQIYVQMPPLISMSSFHVSNQEQSSLGASWNISHHYTLLCIMKN